MKAIKKRIEKRLQDIKLLLDNKETVNWMNDLYDVEYDTDGTLIVVCNQNQYTTKLTNNDILDCYTDKWTIREGIYNLNNINICPDCKLNN